MDKITERLPSERICKFCGSKYVTINASVSKTCSKTCGFLYGRKLALERNGKFKEAKALRIKTEKECLYVKYRVGAKRRGIKFNISQDIFNHYWKKPCVYCGDPIKNIGLDRIDNNFDYMVGNIVPCCRSCNWMKNKNSAEFFISHCKKVAKHSSPQQSLEL